MDFTDVLFGLLIILIVLSVYVFMMRGVKKQRRLNRIWREFAESKGLKEQRASDGAILRFSGENRGMPFVLECTVTEGTPVRIGTLELSSGEETKIFSRMSVRLPEVPHGLRLYKETTWSKLGKAVGMQDITTGDLAFDRAFVVKGADPDAVNAFLSPFRRITLVGHAADLEGLGLEKGELVVVRRGQIDKGEELERLFSRLGSIAADLARS